MKALADIGVVGLAVMGENLILNMENKGFTVACYNRTVAKVDAFLGGRCKGKNLIGCHSPTELVRALARPRKIMMMVRAGKPVDDLIAELTRCWNRAISSLMAVTVITPIPSGVAQRRKRTACSMSARVCLAVKRVR